MFLEKMQNTLVSEFLHNIFWVFCETSKCPGSSRSKAGVFWEMAIFPDNWSQFLCGVQTKFGPPSKCPGSSSSKAGIFWENQLAGSSRCHSRAIYAILRNWLFAAKLQPSIWTIPGIWGISIKIDIVHSSFFYKNPEYPGSSRSKAGVVWKMVSFPGSHLAGWNDNERTTRDDFLRKFPLLIWTIPGILKWGSVSSIMMDVMRDLVVRGPGLSRLDADLLCLKAIYQPGMTMRVSCMMIFPEKFRDLLRRSRAVWCRPEFDVCIETMEPTIMFSWDHVGWFSKKTSAANLDELGILMSSQIWCP